VVNDFHPRLLLAGGGLLPRPGGLAGGAGLARIVHVYGASLYQAIARHFEGRGPDVLDRHFAEWIAALAGRAYARIEHGLAAPAEGMFRPADRTFVLSPLIGLPGRSRDEVRAALGVAPGQKLAAVYLNPHFRDARLAAALRGALAERGFVAHGVGEGLSEQQGFMPYDGSFADIAGAAEVLISAPGMATSAQARAFGLPFVALATDQPEQRKNLLALAGTKGVAPVDLLDPVIRTDLRAALGTAIDRAVAEAAGGAGAAGAEKAAEAPEAAGAAGAAGVFEYDTSPACPGRPALACSDRLAAARAAQGRWAEVLAGLLPEARVAARPARQARPDVARRLSRLLVLGMEIGS
jgi:hypothetical protein